MPEQPEAQHPMTAPADRLREAAGVVRKRATEATPGPWHRPLNTRRKSSVRGPPPEGERGEWIDGIDPSTGERENCTVATIPIWSDGTFARKRGGRDLEWIALMSPAVGEALAAWLDDTAATVEAVTRKHPDAAHEGSHWVAPALALADQILAAVSR